MSLCVVVTGGREFDDWMRVWRVLDELALSLVIHGSCGRWVGGATGEGRFVLTGADSHADRWAQRREAPCLRYPARWGAEFKAAGPKRNARMLKAAQLMMQAGLVNDVLVVAFPGGRGTADCVRQAKALGLPVRDERSN